MSLGCFPGLRVFSVGPERHLPRLAWPGLRRLLHRLLTAKASIFAPGFLSPDRLRWQSQTQTRQDSLISRILSGQEPGTRVHLFIRNGKLRSGKAAPLRFT